MLPQLNAILSLEEEEKQELEGKGLMTRDADGKIFMSLEAINNLGMAMVSNNPMVVMANKLASVGMKVPPFAEATDDAAALAREITERYVQVMGDAILAGIPLLQTFKIVTNGGDVNDMKNCLVAWKEMVLASVTQQEAAVAGPASAVVGAEGVVN